jgi:hypothetical protein
LGISDENLLLDLHLMHLNKDTLLDAVFIGAYGLQWSSIIINKGNGKYQETVNLEMYVIEDLVFDNGELSEIYAFRPEYFFGFNDYVHYRYKNNSVTALTAYCFARTWDADINLPQFLNFHTNASCAVKESPNNEDLSFRDFWNELDAKPKLKPNNNELFYLKKNTKGKIIGQKNINNILYYLVAVKSTSASKYNLFKHFFSDIKTKKKYYIGWIEARNITM